MLTIGIYDFQIYVQNKIEDYGDEIWNLLKNDNGNFFS